MARISEDIISRVIDRCDIVELIASYIPLKRTGSNYKACCPFHNERTPSFVVSSQKQIYHCFGCGEGGNVISFVMKQERIDFPEAVRFLAQKVNIEIPQGAGTDPKKDNIRNSILKLNKLAAEYFHKNLLFDKSQEASGAREYIKQRGIDLETVKDFQLGFAPNKWDGLLLFLRSQDISLSLMEKAGLIVSRSKGDGYYDRFRGRVIFPIFDAKANCRAFGARDIQGESSAKYINSPETPVYTKGHYLFGFHLAKAAIIQDDCAIITEGYLDCITPYRCGLKNIVASLGTALTVDQIRTLRRYTNNVIMLFDTDLAGQSATLRSLDMLIEEGMEVKIVSLEEGQDPDSFVRQRGVEKLKEKVSEAQPLFEYKYQYLITLYDQRLADGKAKIASEMLPTIHKFKDNIKKSEYIRILAQRLSVDEKILIAEYHKIGETLHSRISKRIQENKTSSNQRFASIEHNILKLLLQEETLVAVTKEQMTPEDFHDEEVRNVISEIYHLYEKGKQINVGQLLNSFNDEDTRKMISLLLLKDENHFGDKKRMHQDFLKRIRSDRLKQKVTAIKEEIQEAEQKGDQSRLNVLMKEFNKLITMK